MRAGRNRAGFGAVLALLALLVAGLPAMADDDDDGPGPGPGAEAGAGSPGAADGADPGRGGALGAPGTGNFMRDLRSLLGAFGGAPAPAPPRPSAPPAPAQPPAAAIAVPNEIALIGVDAPARARLLAAGFTVIEERPAVLLPASLVRMTPPRGLSAAAARDRARSLAPAARVDLNHLYRPGGMTAPPRAPSAEASACAAQPVGMIDTALDPASPALAGRRIETVTLRAAGRQPSSPGHGTAVAALLGAALGETPILAVDAFHRRPDGDAADAFDVAAALALLAERGIPVVNLSFAGPANDVLALATEQAAARGMLLAAAAGNDGPRSPPRYPGAHPWVVAVTAVDRERRPFVRAGRGSHVAFAAPGVGLPAPGRGGAGLSGTSYAVPFVTAAFAVAMMREDREGALLRLAGSAVDLGAPGRDPVFGWGLIRPEGGCPGRQALAW